MGVYVKKNFLLVPLVVLSLLVASSYGRLITSKISQGDVNTICRKARDPSFCFNFFKSTPKAKTLNLPGVTKLLIHMASRKGLKVKKEFKSLVKRAENPTAKAIYDECSYFYDNMVSTFSDEVLEDLKVKDAAGLNTHISSAMTDAETCEDEFTDVQISPQLLKKISVIDNLSEIALIISNMLPRNF